MPFQPYIAQIMMFAGNYAPKGWALCNGQTLAINQNQALFALLGTTYGGDGINTFQLPNLQGRFPVDAGNGPGLSSYVAGEVFGEQGVSLTEADIAPHVHSVSALHGPTSGTSASPAAEQWAYSASPAYASSPNATMAPVSAAGEDEPHENRPPFLAVTYCIALVGIFPSRN